MSEKSLSKSQADALVTKDSKHVLRPWSGGAPVTIVHAEGSTVTDVHGKEYLDFTSGYFVNQAGHCHPRIIEAAVSQMGRVMQVSGKQATPASINLAERLVEITPRPLAKTFFATGGSEAIEFAIKMARQHKSSETLAYLDNAYHGLTLGALELCASEKYRQSGGATLSDRTYQIPNPYCYRCKYADNCATQCLDEAEERLDEHTDTAAVVAETVQSVGGIIPPDAWWKRLDEMRRERGLLLILDEIQTGLGRTGAMFAAEHYGLEPDILTAGKGLSGGVGSLSVVLASDEVVDGFYGGTTPTNAGNAVSAAAGLALIDTLIDERLIENSAHMGRYFTEVVADLDDPWVGDIRFKGLLGGVELVADRHSKEVLPRELVSRIADALQEDGMLLTVSGPYGNVLRLQPPLCITAEQLDTFAASLGGTLESVRRTAG
ncbi:MAG: aspartate aminotransferase family protein [Proteobacteria bacterium]|nr:aspartate aminotransferase family protein [Pseudomonadota bacterium]